MSRILDPDTDIERHGDACLPYAIADCLTLLGYYFNRNYVRKQAYRFGYMAKGAMMFGQIPLLVRDITTGRYKATSYMSESLSKDEKEFEEVFKHRLAERSRLAESERIGGIKIYSFMDGVTDMDENPDLGKEVIAKLRELPKPFIAGIQVLADNPNHVVTVTDIEEDDFLIIDPSYVRRNLMMEREAVPKVDFIYCFDGVVSVIQKNKR